MKRLMEYQAVIVDMDGTLYYQRPVRLAMLREMLLHFWRFGDFLIVKRYRRLYECGFDEDKRLSMLPNRAPDVIREWMIERPLKYIWKYRDVPLIGLMQRVSTAGVPVILCSDYPVREKLAALRYSPDQSYTADELGTMKPDASRLAEILSGQGIDPGRCLVIGDRHDKDAVLAENMGADCLLLPSTKDERRRCYQTTLSLD